MMGTVTDGVERGKKAASWGGVPCPLEIHIITYNLKKIIDKEISLVGVEKRYWKSKLCKGREITKMSTAQSWTLTIPYVQNS